MMAHLPHRPHGLPSLRERGASLVVVMLVLLLVTVIGIAGTRLALLSEMSARHDRDTQIAFEAAEAANDQPTCDLLTQRMQVHEKNAWMLRSLLEDSGA